MYLKYFWEKKWDPAKIILDCIYTSRSKKGLQSHSLAQTTTYSLWGAHCPCLALCALGFRNGGAYINSVAMGNK